MAVVDVVTSLTARTVVHIQNQVKTLGTAPFHHRIDAGKAVLLTGEAHIILIGKEPIVEGQTDSVRSLLGNETDVGTGDVVVLELTPEIGGEIRTHSLLNHQVNHPRRVGLAEAEHITLRVQPVAQVGTLNIEFLTIGLHEINSLHADELVLGLSMKPQGKNEREYNK